MTLYNQNTNLQLINASVMQFADERLNPPKEQKNRIEKNNHLERYRFAANWLKTKIPKQSTILDIACGFGYGSDIVSAFLNTGVIGIDIDPKTIQSAKQTYKNIHCTFAVGDIRNLHHIRSGSISAVICFETIEHISLADGEQALSELHRVLSPSGYLIISSPNRFWTQLIHLVKKNPFHIHEYFPNELKQVLEKTGFSIIERFGQFRFNPLIYLFPHLQQDKKQYKPIQNGIGRSLYTIYIAKKNQ